MHLCDSLAAEDRARLFRTVPQDKKVKKTHAQDMRRIRTLGLILMLTASCGTDRAAPIDAAIEPDAASPDAGQVWYTDAFKLVPCLDSWSGVQGGPDPGVLCMAGCANHDLVGRGGAPCSRARTETIDGHISDVFVCTTGTSTIWNGWKGCCMIAPDFAYVGTEPPQFAVCDDDFH